MIWSGRLKETHKRGSLMSGYIFPPTAGTRDITLPMEITSQHTTDGLPYFPFECKCECTEYGKCSVSATPVCVRVSCVGLSLQRSRTHAELSSRPISLVHHTHGGLHVLLETFVHPVVGEVQCVFLWGSRGGLRPGFMFLRGSPCSPQKQPVRLGAAVMTKIDLIQFFFYIVLFFF